MLSILFHCLANTQVSIYTYAKNRLNIDRPFRGLATELAGGDGIVTYIVGSDAETRGQVTLDSTNSKLVHNSRPMKITHGFLCPTRPFVTRGKRIKKKTFTPGWLSRELHFPPYTTIASSKSLNRI